MNTSYFKEGALNPNAKLNEDIVRKIKQDFTQGKSNNTIKNTIKCLYNIDISYTSILKIKRNLTWKHIA